MSEPKFTKGPWQIGNGSMVTYRHQHSQHPLCTLHPPRPLEKYDDSQKAELIANRQLIAAAPDLYEAALIDEAMQTIGYTEAACRWLRERGVEPPPRERLGQWQKEQRRAALAKAGAADNEGSER